MHHFPTIEVSQKGGKAGVSNIPIGNQLFVMAYKMGAQKNIENIMPNSSHGQSMCAKKARS